MTNSNQPVIKLPDALRTRVEEAIIRTVDNAVTACKTRNDILRSYHDQLDRLNSIAQGPWDKSCQLDDPITTEHHLGLQAHFMAGLRYEPYWHIESESPDGEEAAKKVESGLTGKTRQWGVRKALMDASYDAPAYPYAPMYVGWDQVWKKRRMVQYQDPEARVVDADLVEPGIEYKAVRSVQKYLAYEGPVFRQLDPCDFFLSPNACQDPEAADLVIERMYLTQNDLLRGVDAELYEEDSVMEMLSRGCHYVDSDNTRTDMLEADGVQMDGADGYYEVMQVIGKLPLLLDHFGEDSVKIGIPEDLRDEDWLFMVSLTDNLVFRCVPCPYDMRPYCVFYMWREPRRLMAKCITQLLETHQSEADANLRFFIDCLNLTGSPMWKVPESYLRRGSSISAGPGKHIAYPGNNPDSIQPVTWDNHILPLVQGAQGDMRQRARELIGAGGTESLPEPGQDSPTATQTNLVGAQVAAKRDLFMQTFIDFGMERMGQILLSHWQQNLDTGGEQLSAGGKTIDITLADLQAQYRVLAHANTDANNPQMRLQQIQMKIQFQMAYFQGLGVLPPDKWPMLYHGARRAFEETGERNIEGWIGKEPTPGDPMQVLMMALAMLTQAAAAGDQAAPQIIQQVQMAMQGADPNGNGMGQAMGGGQPAMKPPTMTMNFKDTPPEIQQQMEQRAGLQPVKSSSNGTPPGKQT